MADRIEGSAIEAFYSFARQDEALFRQLEQFLRPLERRGLLTGWQRGLLSRSEEAQEVERHLNSASIILLLLSADYLASDDCFLEMERAVERMEVGEAEVVPVLLRPVDIEELSFDKTLLLPTGGKAVTEWPDRDQAFQDIALGLRRILEQRKQFSPVGSMPSNLMVWNIPYGRNPLFTGREEVLQALHEQLNRRQKASFTQPQAISGLGGIGKTQIAIEYAYRYREEYRFVLWVSAASLEILTTSFLELAAILHLPEQSDQAKMIEAVKGWFTTHDGWLVIFDNADDFQLVGDYLPLGGRGHVLLTTRAHAPGTLAHDIEVEKMSQQEGVLLLLRRARVLDTNAPLEQASPTDLEAAEAVMRELDGLPLALDQAGAYIEETQCSMASYLEQYRKRHVRLLQRRGGTGKQHPDPVATTWSLSFQKVEERDPLAFDLLQTCAFLAPEAIPEQLLLDGASELGERLASLTEDGSLLDEAVATLLRFSFVKRYRDAAILSVHRLVQVVLKSSMDEQTQQLLAERTVRAVNKAFSDLEFRAWPYLLSLLPHAQVCATLIDQWQFAFPEAGRLCNQAGYFLEQFGQYGQAEGFYQRAIAIGEKTFGQEHPDLGTWLNNLAVLYQAMGRYAEGETLCQRALSIDEKLLGAEHPATAQSLSTLAELYQALGRYAEGLPLCLRALGIRERALGSEHPDTAQSLNILAEFYLAQEKFEEAEPLLRRALMIREKMLGPEHPAIAQSLNTLARLYLAQGKYEEGEALCRRALMIREKMLGPEHPAIAQSLNTLAELDIAQSKYTEADQVVQRAIAICEQLLGQEHPDTAQNLNTMAACYRALGKYAEGEILCQRALLVREKVLGPEHPDTVKSLNLLVELYQAQGKDITNEPFYLRIRTTIEPLPSYTWQVWLEEGAEEPGSLQIGQALTLTLRLTAEQHPTSQPLRLPLDALELAVYVQAPGFHLIGEHLRTLPVVEGRPLKRSLNIQLLAVASGPQNVRLLVCPGSRHEGLLPVTLTRSFSVQVPKSLPAIPELLDRQAIPPPQPEVLLYLSFLEYEGRPQLQLYLTCPLLGLEREALEPALALMPADVAALREAAAQVGTETAEAAPTDLLASLRAFGASLFDLLMPPGHRLRSLYWQVRRLAGAPAQPWAWLVVADERAVLPWELLCPYRTLPSGEVWYDAFLGEAFVLAHWIGRQGLTLRAEAPVGGLALDHYYQRPQSLPLWHATLQDESLDGDQQGATALPGHLTLMQPGSSTYGLHVLRYTDPQHHTRITSAQAQDTEHFTNEAEAMLYRQRLDFTLRRPVLGLSLLNGQPEPGGLGMPLEQRQTQLEESWALPFLHAGASAVVGPYWPVSEEVDQHFYRAFYAAMRSGAPLGWAVWEGRQQVKQRFADRADWLAYAYFGHPWCQPYAVQAVQGFTLFEAVDHQEGTPFEVGQPYQFRASYRLVAPLWYSGRVRHSQRLAGGEEVSVLVAPLTGAEPGIYPLQLAGEGRGEDYQCVVTLQMPQEETTLPVLIRFQQGEDELRSLTLKLKVRRATKGEIGASQTGGM